MKPSVPSDIPPWKKKTPHGKGRGAYVQGGFDLAKPLYRYMRASDLCTLLRTSHFYMRNVRAWTDPFEKWWCENLFQKGSKLAGVNAYGSCWTRRKRNEPFWRLYQDRCDHRAADGSPLPAPLPPVRIRTSGSKILAMLSAGVDLSEAKAFIGNVQYCRTRAIQQIAAELRSCSENVAADAASALHLKRYGFWFESEVRVLWIDRASEKEAHLIGIHPLDIIDDVMVGPTLDRSAATRVTEDIVALGVPRKMVRMSLIYGDPDKI